MHSHERYPFDNALDACRRFRALVVSNMHSIRHPKAKRSCRKLEDFLHKEQHKLLVQIGLLKRWFTQRPYAMTECFVATNNLAPARTRACTLRASDRALARYSISKSLLARNISISSVSEIAHCDEHIDIMCD